MPQHETQTSKSQSQTTTPPVAILRCQNPEALNDANCLEIRLNGHEMFIGRGSENHVVLQAYGISRRHARMFVEQGNWHVEDLDSTNGVRLNHNQVKSARIFEGDSVAFGRIIYTFNRASQSPEDIRDTSLDVDLGLADKTVSIRPGTIATPTPQTNDSTQITSPPHNPHSSSYTPAESSRSWGTIVLLGLVLGVAVIGVLLVMK